MPAPYTTIVINIIKKDVDTHPLQMWSSSLKSLLRSISCCQNFWQKAFRGLYKFAIIFLNMSLTPRPLLNNFKNCNFGTSRLLLGKEMVSWTLLYFGWLNNAKNPTWRTFKLDFFHLGFDPTNHNWLLDFPPSYRKRRSKHSSKKNGCRVAPILSEYSRFIFPAERVPISGLRMILRLSC